MDFDPTLNLTWLQRMNPKYFFFNLKLSFIVEDNSAANVLQWHPLKLLKFDNFT